MFYSAQVFRYILILSLILASCFKRKERSGMLTCSPAWKVSRVKKFTGSRGQTRIARSFTSQVGRKFSQIHDCMKDFTTWAQKHVLKPLATTVCLPVADDFSFFPHVLVHIQI